LALPIVAIIGRPNVGKSSLFNRLVGRRHAIVSDVAGTTRDRLMAEAQWDDHQFILVDTGGLESNPEGTIREKVQEQAAMALSAADVIIFVTDVVEGLSHADLAVADRLRRTHKPVILAVNKVDNDSRELAAPEFYRLGLSDPLPISAYHNFGIYELMEKVLSYFPSTPGPEEELVDIGSDPADPGELKLAIVGRTNVGKSMLLNAILGQERSIVSQVAGTTRDALDTNMTYNGHDLVLIDTAGIRRPGQVQRGIEKYSVIRAVSAVNRCDIALLVTDAAELATAQDAHIAGLTWDVCRGLIVVVNKWDLTEEDGRAARAQASARVLERLHFMRYVLICFTSALNGEGIGVLMQTALELWRERLRYVPSRELQYLLADALASHAPPPVKGHRNQRLRISRLRQVDVNPPTFLFAVDNPNLIHFTYQRYLENKLRSTFGFDHTHLRLVFKKQ
jgi:GTP-binding protein